MHPLLRSSGCILGATALLSLGACGFPDHWEFTASETTGTNQGGGENVGSSSSSTSSGPSTGGSGGAGGSGGSGGSSSGSTGGSGGCAPGLADCDGQPANGCEVTLASNDAHCGQCNSPCKAGEGCVSGKCLSACPLDEYEPNDVVQAPAPPPMPGNMRELSPGTNIFKLSEARSAFVSPSMTTSSDVDVFHLEISDDLPNPPQGQINGANLEISLSGIPAGATYSVETHFTCKTGSIQYFVHPSNTKNCAPNEQGTGYVGNWWRCQRFAPAPSLFYVHGYVCEGNKTNGTLQIKVSVIGPPTQHTCDAYVLNVKPFGVQLTVN